ncbi:MULTISPECIES: ECF transporter S component [Carnobacterium]|uniref:Riboflavin transporter n=2 Tax=Carnobacterium inhibens TaxID=147709 RepID=U5SBV3_9LACT|nr:MULTISPECIES: ECF transporter S component [Carnobacterium]AGY81578.1 FMN permease [Carnobacterium inhibens subsp. gilichinskyi]MBC9824728.1 ECF transporter S component [Carnobacterium inhibens]MCM3512669.1 ECF transporter S component [Carnobacterium inhibens]MDN5371496.1 riboflavin transporter [Carnobacterium sp.]
MQTSNTKKMVGIAMLAALATILISFGFPIIPGVSFLKVDFSDIPVLIGMFLYGPVGGTMVAFIRSLLHYIQTGGDAGYPIGDTASFIASVAYTLPIYLIMKSKVNNTKTIIFANIVGSLSLAVILSLVNYFFLLPLYLKVLNFSVGPIRDYILMGVIPFNIIKGAIVSTVFIMLYAKLKTWLQRNQLTKISAK